MYDYRNLHSKSGVLYAKYIRALNQRKHSV